jgi:quercetin dioxygenase-like cupin family protein
MRPGLTSVKAVPGLRGDPKLMIELPLIDLSREKILSLAQETQYAPNGIVSRVLLKTPTFRVVLFGFAAGQELTEHTSTSHAMIQILAGQCEFSLAGTPRTMKSGDLLYMPPNLAHAVKATEQFSMLLTLFKPAETMPRLTPVQSVASAESKAVPS